MYEQSADGSVPPVRAMIRNQIPASLRADCRRAPIWPFGHGVGRLTVGLALLLVFLVSAGYSQEPEDPVGQEILIEALDPKGQVITGQISANLEVLEDGERLGNPSTG